MSRPSRRFGALFAGASLVLAAACGTSSVGGGSRASKGAAPATGAARAMFVAIGDDASAPVESSIPISGSWPQQFFRSALARDTVFVNLSTQAASARIALEDELPIARQLHPTIVGVALGLADLVERNPALQFGASLDALIAGLRGAGARTVLVATLPDELRGVADYNRAIVDAARRNGAVLVDLTPLQITFVHDETAVVPIPDRASQQAIGRAFAAAYRSSTSG